MNIAQSKLSFIKKANPILGVLKPILGFVGIFMVWGIIGEMCVILVLKCMRINIFSSGMQNSFLAQVMKLLGYVFFIVGTIIYCKFVEKRSVKSMGFVKKGFVINYLIGCTTGIFLISAVLLISIVFGALSYNGISNNINVLYILAFLAGYIIQGMSEEVMARGYLMTSLSNKTSMLLAILFSSLAFAAPHLPSLLTFGIQFGVIGFINTMLLSFLVSLLMIERKNIWVICGLHSSWNYILGIVCGISVSGGEANASILNFTANESKSLINGGMYGLEAGIITTVIYTIVIVYMILSMKRKKVI